MRIKIFIFEINLKAIHNKDYSVVKTFKVAPIYRGRLFLFHCCKAEAVFPPEALIKSHAFREIDIA